MKESLRINKYRTNQSKRDRLKEFKPEKKQVIYPEYFSYYPTLTKLKPIEIKNYYGYLRACSCKRDNILGFYLATILCQNPKLEKVMSTKSAHKSEINEQSRRFLLDKKVMLFDYKAVNLDGIITFYDDYMDVVNENDNYDLIILPNDSLVEVYNSLPSFIFEDCLRQDISPENQDNKILTQEGGKNTLIKKKDYKKLLKKTEKIAKKTESPLEEALEEIFIETATNNFKQLYSYMGDEEKYQKTVKHIEEISPLLLAFSSNSGEYIKELLRYSMADIKKTFRNLFPEIQRLCQENDPLKIFCSKLSPKGILVLYTNPYSEKELIGIDNIDGEDYFRLISEYNNKRANYVALTSK